MIKIILILLTFIFISFGFISRSFARPNSENPNEQKNQKFQELEKTFKGDVEMINNSKASWLTSRGNHYGERGEFEKAIMDFKEAIQFKSDYIASLFWSRSFL